ncbi:MAG: DNRLRE domain-containing protein, partial [Caldilinea sp.]|nr:DNRLRE domain-containing protein [Caldilinea sp.]
QDTTIDNYFPKTPAGTAPVLLVSYDVDSTAQPVRERAALIQFDLSAIPEGSTVTRAELGLYQRASIQPQAMDLAIRQVIAPWSNATTWETRPGAITLSIPLWPMAKSDGAYITVEVTSLVDAWVNAPVNTPNYG